MGTINTSIKGSRFKPCRRVDSLDKKLCFIVSRHPGA